MWQGQAPLRPHIFQDRRARPNFELDAVLSYPGLVTRSLGCSAIAVMAKPSGLVGFKFPAVSAARLPTEVVDPMLGRSKPSRLSRDRMESPMCDFSLQTVRSRPAKVGDKLVTRDFGTGTRGFADVDDRGTAVCLMPGTELAFAGEIACLAIGLLVWKSRLINHQTAIFRQVNKEKLAAHHDALEFPDGRTVLLTLLCEGQTATVLQLPAQPRTETEEREQVRVGFVG
jgi:hypothetical protein